MKLYHFVTLQVFGWACAIVALSGFWDVFHHHPVPPAQPHPWYAWVGVGVLLFVALMSLAPELATQLYGWGRDYADRRQTVRRAEDK